MWRTILLIQRYSTVARTVGIPNPNRPLLSGADTNVIALAGRLRVSILPAQHRPQPALKISTVSIRVLQGPYDDVLSNVGVCNIHRLTTSAVAYRNIHRLVLLVVVSMSTDTVAAPEVASQVYTPFPFVIGWLCATSSFKVMRCLKLPPVAPRRKLAP